MNNLFLLYLSKVNIYKAIIIPRAVGEILHAG